MPATSDELLAFLGELGIPTQTIAHAAAHTVEAAQALRGEMPGGHFKNLFVKDKKGRFFLLALEEEKQVDLKRVHEAVGGQGRVSFGTAEQLEEFWGVKPGSVTPFGAINDKAGKVTLIFDSGLMRHERVNFHPLVNTRTTGLSRQDLLRFLRATGHEPLVVDLPAPSRDIA